MVKRNIPPVYKKAQNRIARDKEIILLWITRGKSFSYGCAKAGISYDAAKRWKNQDAIFKAACEEAYEIGTEGLEDIADSRAKRRSDVLLMFLMKARNRAKYGDNKVTVEVQAAQVKRREF